MRFIGELYKQKQVVSVVVKHCLKQLLDNALEADDEKLESAMKLLSTVGKTMDSSTTHRASMDAWFAILDTIVQSKRSARVRFMIENLVVARNGGWRNTEREGTAVALLLPSLPYARAPRQNMPDHASVATTFASHSHI